MNYQEFITTICEGTNQHLFPDATVQIHTALKNNGTERIGLTIAQPHTNISPTIYLEEYYLQYQNGRDIDDIIHSIVKLYHEVKFEHDWDVEQLQNFSLIKSKIAFKLIHREKNQNLLETIPHIPYLDLAIVFFLLIETTEHGTGTILISEEMLTYWKISLEELHQIALGNTPKLLPVDFKPMRTVICELIGESPSEDDWEESYMYVLSNQYRHFGAGCILYDRVLEDIGNQLNEDFYILPSSIHEVIILPISHNLNQEDLNEMIVEINETQVSKEDILSNHAYYYSRENQDISIHISLKK